MSSSIDHHPKKKTLESSNSPNWLDLPRDATASILLKLGAIEILETAQKVCTQWRRICKDPSMWKSIDMSNFGDVHNVICDLQKMAMHAVDRSRGDLLEITVEFFGNDLLLKYIAERSPNLRCLRYRCSNYLISDKGMKSAAKKLPLLEELELTYCDVSFKGLEAVGRRCPLLKSLKMNTRALQEYLYPSNEEALAIGNNMHGLHFLQLIGNSLTNVGLKAILDGCPDLESLDLRRCFNINLEDEVWKLCVERIKNLRRPDDSTDDCELTYGSDQGSYDGASDLSDPDVIYGDLDSDDISDSDGSSISMEEFFVD